MARKKKTGEPAEEFTASAEDVSVETVPVEETPVEETPAPEPTPEPIPEPVLKELPVEETLAPEPVGLKVGDRHAVHGNPGTVVQIMGDLAVVKLHRTNRKVTVRAR